MSQGKVSRFRREKQSALTAPRDLPDTSKRQLLLTVRKGVFVSALSLSTLNDGEAPSSPSSSSASPPSPLETFAGASPLSRAATLAGKTGGIMEWEGVDYLGLRKGKVTAKNSEEVRAAGAVLEKKMLADSTLSS